MAEGTNRRRSFYYDRQGQPMSVEAVMSLPREYKRVAETTLEDGTWISTVWLGIDQSFYDEGQPLIFETMVFEARHCWSKVLHDEQGREMCWRYATEEEALNGHKKIVAFVAATINRHR